MNSHVNDPHILYTDFRLNNLAASDSITYNTVSKHTYNGCNKKIYIGNAFGMIIYMHRHHDNLQAELQRAIMESHSLERNRVLA